MIVSSHNLFVTPRKRKADMKIGNQVKDTVRRQDKSGPVRTPTPAEHSRYFQRTIDSRDLARLDIMKKDGR